MNPVPLVQGRSKERLSTGNHHVARFVSDAMASLKRRRESVLAPMVSYGLGGGRFGGGLLFFGLVPPWGGLLLPLGLLSPLDMMGVV